MTRSTIRNNVFWSYANWGVASFSPIVLVPIYLHFLGARTYGYWLVILSITSYLSLANLGLGQTLSNRVADGVGRAGDSNLAELVSTGFFAFAAIGAALLVILSILAPLIDARLLVHSGNAVLIAFFTYVALNLLSFPFRIYSMLLRGFERVDQEQAITAITNIARIAFLAALLFAGFGLVTVAIVNGFVAIVSTAAAYLWSRRITGDVKPRLAFFSVRLLREMVMPSLAFLAIQVGSTLITGLDNLVIGYALGAAAVTTYAVSFRLITICAGLFGVISAALVPTITINFARRTKSELHEPFIFATRMGIAYATAGAIALWIAGPTVLRLWVGSAIFPGSATFGLQILMFWMLIWGSVPAAFLWATTHHYAWSLMALFEGVLNLVLSLWWVRLWGLAGVIAGTVAASSVTSFWFLPWAAFAALDFPRTAAIRRLVPALVLSAIAGAGVFAFAAPNPQTASIVVRIVQVIFVEAGYLTLYILLAISAGDRRRILDWLMPLARRAALAVN